ncbi:MAG TPA: endonuclease III [Actinomycetota bacterium]|jgi:endonuclease-3
MPTRKSTARPAAARPTSKRGAKREAKPGNRKVPPLKERAPEVIARLKAAYPGATVALRFTNPLECLIATILSAQTTDENVNRVTQTLFQKYRTPQDYLAVPEEELAADLKPTGFFNQKTKSVRGACREIVERFDGQVPRTMAELVTLPGVARKTANIVQGNAYPQEHAADPDAGVAVDTHVRRLAYRLGFSKQTDPEKVERDLMKVIPREDWFGFTYVLIDHGRAVCKAPVPRCDACAVAELCPSSLV